MNTTQKAEEYKAVAKALYIYLVAGKTHDPYVFQLISESKKLLSEIENDVAVLSMTGKSDLKGLAAYDR